MKQPKKYTRIDVWTLGDYIDFMEWAKTKNPKTKEDMVRLLGEYRKADIVVEERKEIVEHIIHEGVRSGKLRPKKGDKK